MSIRHVKLSIQICLFFRAYMAAYRCELVLKLTQCDSGVINRYKKNCFDMDKLCYAHLFKQR